ncbi:kinetochore protein Nuf2 [Mytilus galloprovincialis]|uniref:Kinetochore protein Nuf2 n=1 Tax=Mytilus galloprovincialis TaxID=29158 RepID=A0A8B6FRJ4_MYTGA|nr:kinetochore protein Nuf2 [Mytilus galloprovincialis]
MSGDDQSFQFPPLEIHEIVRQLRSIGNILTEENDFKRPDPNRWAKLYPQILEALEGVPYESTLQNSLHFASFEYPELYEESMPAVVLTLALSRVLGSCGIKNFSIADIHEPKPARLRRICSAVVNFILFKGQQCDVYRNLREETESSVKEFEHVAKMNAELKMKINAIKSVRSEQEPEIIRVQQDIQARTVTMNEMEKVKNEKKKASSEIKEAVAEKQANTEKIRVMTLKTKEEMDRLSQKIVQSPERVREGQENMKQQLVNMKCGMDKKWESLQEMEQRLETVIQGTTKVDQMLKLLTDLKNDKDKGSEISNEINHIVEKSQEQRMTLTHLRAKKDQLQQIMNGKLEKRDKLDLQQQNKHQSLTEAVNSLQQQKEFFRQRFDTDEAQKSGIRKQEQQIIDSINEEYRKFERKKEVIMSLYHQILERIDNNHKELGSGWEALCEIMQKVTKQLDN